MAHSKAKRDTYRHSQTSKQTNQQQFRNRSTGGRRRNFAAQRPQRTLRSGWWKVILQRAHGMLREQNDAAVARTGKYLSRIIDLFRFHAVLPDVLPALSSVCVHPAGVCVAGNRIVFLRSVHVFRSEFRISYSRLFGTLDFVSFACVCFCVREESFLFFLPLLYWM